MKNKLDSGFQTVHSGFHVLDFSLCKCLDYEIQSLVGFRIPRAVFQISKPRIPDSKCKNFTDPGIWIPLLGAIKNVLLVSQKNLNPGHICIKN